MTRIKANVLIFNNHCKIHVHAKNQQQIKISYRQQALKFSSYCSFRDMSNHRKPFFYNNLLFIVSETIDERGL